MTNLDLDLTIPIALLVSAILGVMVVRFLLAQGDRRAAARTKRIVEHHLNPDYTSSGQGTARAASRGRRPAAQDPQNAETV